MMETPTWSVEMDIGNSRQKGQPPQATKKNFKRVKSKTLRLTLEPVLQKSVRQMTHAPQHSLQGYFQQPRHRPKKRSPGRLNLKEIRHIYTLGFYSDMKNHHEIMKLCHWSRQGWMLEDHIFSVLSNTEKTQQMMSLLHKKKTYNTARDLKIQTQRLKKKGKGQV